MDVDVFLNQHVLRSPQQRVFFHFTDMRNLPSIRQHGLLSTQELKKRGIVVPAFGGNQWSLDADRAKGMDAFVHLCFMVGHPMVSHAVADGRFQRVIYLKVRPDIIKQPGVMMTIDVANQSGVVPLPPSQALDALDIPVIYTRTKWKDPAVNARLQAAHRCEVLVPNSVATEFIENLGHG